jgi:hypothetical protein
MGEMMIRPETELRADRMSPVISVRLANALMNLSVYGQGAILGIATPADGVWRARDLAAIDPQKFRKLKGVGETTFREARDVLRNCGMLDGSGWPRSVADVRERALKRALRGLCREHGAERVMELLRSLDGEDSP